MQKFWLLINLLKKFRIEVFFEQLQGFPLNLIIIAKVLISFAKVLIVIAKVLITIAKVLIH